MGDPDISYIKEICQSLIGAKIQISFTIEFENKTTINTTPVSNCNIMGYCMEDILFSIFKEKIPTFEKGPKQSSPDYWNRNKKYEWELKTFTGQQGFDVSNFLSYIHQLKEDGGVERKLFKTKYIILKYTLVKNYIYIEDYKICNIWNLINFFGKYPLSIQNKKGMWYNIRPCTFTDISNKSKTPYMFIKNMSKAIKECPNKIDNKNEIIHIIERQFYKICFDKCLHSLNLLKD